MRKTLLYLAIIITVASALLALFNFTRYRKLVLKQTALIEEQRKDSLDIEAEMKELQEKASAATTNEEANKEELMAAKEAEAKAESELVKVQQELAEKEAELMQLKGDKDTKPLETSAPAATDVKVQDKTVPSEKSSEKKSSAADSKNEKDAKGKETKSSHLQGKVLAVNGTWSFVVINIGEQNGVTTGREFLIKHGEQTIAKAKVTSVEPSTSVADIVPDNGASKAAVQVGDVVAEVPEE